MVWGLGVYTCSVTTFMVWELRVYTCSVTTLMVWGLGGFFYL